MNRSRIRWTSLLLLLSALAMNAASAQKINTELDPKYNIAGLKTFAFAPLDAKDSLSSRPEIAQQIRADLTGELAKLGMQMDESHPDFLISYSATREDYNSTYTSSATGVTSENETFSNPYSVGTLVAIFLDAKTKHPFWRGTSTETVYSGSLQKYVPKGVKKMMGEFRKDIEKQRKK